MEEVSLRPGGISLRPGGATGVSPFSALGKGATALSSAVIDFAAALNDGEAADAGNALPPMLEALRAVAAAAAACTPDTDASAALAAAAAAAAAAISDCQMRLLQGELAAVAVA